MDKKFYYKTPALVAMTLAGTTLVSHQVNAEETSSKDNKNIIEQHNNASQIQDEQKELKSQSLNVSGTKTYKDPSIIDEPKVTEDTSKDTSDVVNTDNTASQDVTNQDTTEAVQDTEDNTSEDATDVVDSDESASQDVTNQDSTEAVQDTEDNTSEDTTDDVNSDESASQDVEDQDGSEVAQNTEDNTTEDTSDVVNSDEIASQDVTNQDTTEAVQDTVDNTSEDTTDVVNSDNTGSQDVTNQDSTEAVQDTVDNTSEDTSDDVNSDNTGSQDVTNQDGSEVAQNTEDNSSEDTSDVVNSDNTASQDVTNQDSTEAVQDTEDNTSEDTSDVVNSDNTASQDVEDQDGTETVQDTVDNTSEDTSGDVNSDNTASQDVEDQDGSEVAQNTEDNSSEDTSDVVDSGETASQDVEDQGGSEVVQNTEDITSEDTTDVVDSDETSSQDVDDQDSSEVAQDTEDNTSDDASDVVDSDETSSQDVEDQNSTEDAQDTEDNTSEDTTDVVDSDDASDDEYNFDFDDQDDTSNDIESNSIDNNQNVQLESANVKPQVRTFAARSARSIPTSTYRSTYNAAVSSTINNQIRNNNYAVPNYVEDFSSHIPKIPYRNGVGKPEGVIAHETANPNSTIHGEIAYMKNNYESAFVHAFVDDNNIIEVAPTDYLAWGAGGVANQRFIHVELVRVYGGDRFARSINNYADYIATNLAYYGLPFDSAEYDGNGTLWSHDAVSKYLGGTNHSDPYGWFAENNYTFNELVDLVHEKYQYKTGTLTAPSKPIVTKPKPTKPVVKPTTKPTKPVVTKPKPTKPVVGTAKTVAVNYKGKVNINASGVYSSVYDKTTKPATNKAGKTFNIGKQSTFNNQVFYLLQDNNGTPLGWVKSSDIQLQTVTKPTPKPVVKPTTKPVVKPTTKPVAKPTTKPVAKPTTKPVAKPTTKPVAKPTTKPVASTAKTVAVNYKGKVNTNASGVYSSVYDKTTKPAVNKAGKTFNIGKQSTYNNQVFYLLQDTKGTPLGWVKSSDIQLQNTTKPVAKPATKPVAKPATKPVVKPATKPVAKPTTKPVAKPATKPVAKPATKPVAKPATKPVAKPITKPVAKPATKPVAKTVRVNYVGKVNNNISGVYTSVYDQKTVPAMNKAGKTFKIGKQSTYNNQTYYLLQDNNAIPLGWVKANDVQLQTNRVQPKPVKQVTPAQPKKTNAIKSNVVNNQPMNLKENYTNYLIFDNTGYFYSQPNVSKSTLLGSLQNYQYAYFKVISSQKVGNELWYKGLLNGKTVWINSKYLQLATEATNISTSPYTLDQAVDIQMALRNGSEPKKVLPSGIRNATRAEVKDAMDTSKYVNDPVQKYQFLDLNKSQNISPSKLNELLRGKGILENQGNAFSQASKAVGINEIYLISHALLETGNGTSQLANGGNIDKNGKVDLNSKTKYYNMFGVGAIDKNALYGGIKYAQQAGWNTPEKAIFGGAQFIANNYIKAGQNTLYKMRFNPQKPGVHQYATGIDFSKSNAKRISDFYQQIQTDGQFYDVDQYKS
ncbi:GW dipeptide domain-containing protein [Mammaliicoccus fleurettii]|nr:GW dipeptide domain-containing protein [Mammaliicoccus fleurettii]